jgi:hypothetical protein
MFSRAVVRNGSGALGQRLSREIDLHSRKFKNVNSRGFIYSFLSSQDTDDVKTLQMIKEINRNTSNRCET